MDSNYCFPPQSEQPRQRARSFNAPVRPADGPRRSHAHRRSAAVSEDLSGIDFSQYMEPKGRPMGQHLEPSSPFRFGAGSQRDNGAPHAQSAQQAQPTQHGQHGQHAQHPSLSLNHINSSESSLASDVSGAGSVASRGPRVSFVEPRSPQRSTRSPHRTELGPQVSIPSLKLDDTSASVQPPSPTMSVGSGSSRHGRRRSLLNLFRKKPDLSASAAAVSTGSPTAAEREVTPSMTPPTYEEPEPPRISLDEARGCGHRRSESLPMTLDTPFSPYKRASFIGPVVEEREEDEEDGDLTVRLADRSKHTIRECPSSESCASVSQLAILDPPPLSSSMMPLQGSSPTSLSSSSSSSSRSMLSNPSLLYSPRGEPKLKPFALGEPGALAPPQAPKPSHRRRRSLAALFGRQS